MRSGIVGAEISFDFDDAPAEQLVPLPPHEEFAEQIRPDQARVAVVEGAG